MSVPQHHVTREEAGFNSGLNAGLSVVSERLRYWRDRRAKNHPETGPGQVERELAAIESRLNALAGVPGPAKPWAAGQ